MVLLHFLLFLYVFIDFFIFLVLGPLLHGAAAPRGGPGGPAEALRIKKIKKSRKTNGKIKKTSKTITQVVVLLHFLIFLYVFFDFLLFLVLGTLLHVAAAPRGGLAGPPRL